MFNRNFLDKTCKRFLPLLLSVSIMWASASTAEKLNVTLLTPGLPDNTFWPEVIAFAEAVAEDLEINLNIVSSPYHGSSYAIRRTGLEIINSDQTPDYLVTGFWTSATVNLISAAQAKDIRVFIINTGITVREKLFVGTPRAKFKNWIGHMRPDDKRAGYDLADILINHAVDKANSLTSKSIKLAALFGDEFSSVGDDRKYGLLNRMQLDNTARLSASYKTNWGRESATRTTLEILQDEPDTAIIWAASDALALGAIEVLKVRDRKPGQDVFLGGFDWTRDGINAVKTGELSATMGGHFMEAGWALILLYDYHNNIDFTNDPGLSTVTTMHAITESNVTEYLERFGNRDWNKINFRNFSKKHNPELKRYNFSLQAILNSHKN